MAQTDNSSDPRPRRGLETARAFALAVLLALAIRSFIVEPFTIPSGSMIPTLLVGDFILVNKFSYGVRLPVTGTLLVPVGEPERGDVVVFRFPDDPSQDFIKRVIGLPGDRVEIKGDRVLINGQPLDRVDEGESSYFDVERARDVPVRLYREFDGNGGSHPVIHQPGRLGIHRRGPWKVPEGHYFMMGDNRDASSDSRAWKVSFVRADQLKGRAMVIHWSWIVTAGERRPDNPVVSLFDTLWRLVTFQIEKVRWSRIGTPVR